jgi:hypothetical protein
MVSGTKEVVAAFNWDDTFIPKDTLVSALVKHIKKDVLLAKLTNHRPIYPFYVQNGRQVWLSYKIMDDDIIKA